MTCLLAVFITEKPTTLTLPFGRCHRRWRGRSRRQVAIRDGGQRGCANHRRVFGRVVDRFISGGLSGIGGRAVAESA